MSSPLSRLALRVAYGARQLPRMAWYVGHSLALRRLAEETRRREGRPPRAAQTDRPVPERASLYADMAELLRADLENVERGIYPLPADRDGPPLAMLRRSLAFFQDLPQVHRRREADARYEVRDEADAKRPDYYLQNFHFQSGGWLTDDSAKLYDTQVEVLFNGTANAIRRQALPALHEVFAGRDQRKLKLLDIGSGTGRFLESVKQVWPKLPVFALDLSEPYLKHARRHLRRRSQAHFILGNAEAIPLPDASLDAVTSIFMVHELPPAVRRTMMAECARVLRKGGRLILLDSLQTGDKPDYDGLFDLFPQSYHEPYYESYLDEDFSALARDAGLKPAGETLAFIAKVMVFDKA